MTYTISLFLDTRRAKQTGKYPVKLRVFTIHPRKQKLYALPYEFAETEFNSIWKTERTRGEHKQKRYELEAVEAKAKKTAEKIKPFNFTSFEKKFFQETSTKNDVYNYLEEANNRCKNDGRIGTGELYSQTSASLKAFQGHYNRNINRLSFSEITPEWLQNYENYMVKISDRSLTTVGMYMRNLRAVFNFAISEKEISPDVYPFGLKKYEIPQGQNTKKALNMEQIKTLFNTKPETPEQEKAKCFWFFSYLNNGMNLKDIALLRYKDIDGDMLTFYRAKTINTAKKKRIPIKCYLVDFTHKVIKKYGTENKNNYIFSIINDEMTEEKKHSSIKYFTRFVNEYFGTVVNNAGIKSNVTTYWARHSYATNMIRNKASMEQVMKALGHKNLNTTDIYFSGFEDKEIKELTGKLINF